MALTPPLDQLVHKLRVQTEAGRLAWEETADQETFVTSVGKFVVTLGKEESAYDPTKFTLRVSDPSGKPLELGEDNQFSSLAQLHEKARRRALDVDAQLNELLASLD